MPSMAPQGRWALVIGVGAYPWLTAHRRLRGAVADAEAVADHLQADWGFAAAGVRRLLDEEATYAGIRDGMEWLVASAAPGDAVVLYFAGHGCRWNVEDPEELRLRPDRKQKFLVPWDGGEAEQPSLERGIGGDVFRAWLPRLAERTSNVTLIFDCCHSGTVTRDGWGGRVRGLDPQGPSQGHPPLAAVDEPRWLGGSASGGGVDHVAVAASRFDRHAYEFVAPDGTHRGVFTWYLVRQLERASRLGLSLAWQDVVDAVAVDVGSHCPYQHPRLEGRRDRELFGLREAPGRRFATVTERDGGAVRLAAGRLQQVVRGSQWRVVAAGAAPEVGRSDEPRPAGTPLGSLRVTDVEVAASTAMVEEETSPGAIAPPARTWLAALPDEDDDLRMPVAVRSGSTGTAAEALRTKVAASPYLRLVEAGRGEEVTVLVPEPGGDGDPLQLGDLSAIAGRCWLAVGRDGLPVAPPHRLGGESVEVMVENLEKRARQRQLRLLRSPQSNETRSSETEPWVGLTILRQAAEGTWEAVDEEYVFRAGERFAFALTNRFREPLHVNLLGLGFGGGTSPLHPVAHAAAPLSPGATVSFGTRPGESLCFLLPPRYPYLPGAPYRRERELFKLIATSEEADYRLFFQDSYRDPARLPGLSGDRLGRFLGWYACGTAYRGASTRPTGPAGWSAYTRGPWLDTRPSGTA